MSRGQWSALMFDLLESLGDELGYKVKREPGEGSLVDMTWARGGQPVVAIEHENRVRSIEPLKKQVANLLAVGHPLKVLITYFGVSKFHQLLSWLRSKILKRVRTVNRFDFELLAVVGAWEWGSDSQDDFWFAYRFHPHFRATPLVFASPLVDLKPEHLVEPAQ